MSQRWLRRGTSLNYLLSCRLPKKDISFSNPVTGVSRKQKREALGFRVRVKGEGSGLDDLRDGFGRN